MSTASVQLEDLAALNDEIAALSRAGLPLEAGLMILGRDMPGRLGRLATKIAEQTSLGRSLPEALEQCSVQVPPAYRAVLLAGIRSGRLPAALEAVSVSIRRTMEGRRALLGSMLYPLLLVTAAVTFFAIFTRYVAPVLADTVAYFEAPGIWLLQSLAGLGQSAVYWAPAAILAAALVACFWVWRTGGAELLQPARYRGMPAPIPGMRRLRQLSQAALFTEVLQLLLEAEAPLPEAVSLAAQSTGQKRLIADCDRLAERLRAGEPLDMVELRDSGLPPMVRWLLAGGGRGTVLTEALRLAAEDYRERARRQLTWMQLLLPIALTVVIGGTVTLAFGLLTLLPYINVLRTLAQ